MALKHEPTAPYHSAQDALRILEAVARHTAGVTDTELAGALKFNRKLWNVFLNSATREENPLPVAIRQNIANLGIFVLNHTIKLEARPEPSRLDVLININREVAAGLRASQTP